MATVQGKSVLIGKAEMLGRADIEPLGSEMASAIAGLRDLGIGRMIMISGDHRKAAGSIAGEVGITEAWGDLRPD